MPKKNSENSVCQSSIYKVVILIAQLQKRWCGTTIFKKQRRTAGDTCKGREFGRPIYFYSFWGWWGWKVVQEILNNLKMRQNYIPSVSEEQQYDQPPWQWTRQLLFCCHTVALSYLSRQLGLCHSAAKCFHQEIFGVFCKNRVFAKKVVSL